MSGASERTIGAKAKGTVLLTLGLEGAEPVGPRLVAHFEAALRRALDRPGAVAAALYRRDESWAGAGRGPDLLGLLEVAPDPERGALPRDAGSLARAFALDDAPPPGARSLGLASHRLLGEQRPPAATAADPGTGLLYVRVEVDPAHDAAFRRWYVDVHVPAILAAPGMIGARRFEHRALDATGRPPPGQPRYCTLYEMQTPDVIARPATLEASDRGACPPEIAPHRRASNQVYALCFRERARR